MPVTLLFPARREAANLLVPVCSSASHVAYATVRMEPQFMMLGHAAGVVAALTAKNKNRNKNGSATAVQDVDPVALTAALLADGQIVEPPAAKPRCRDSAESAIPNGSPCREPSGCFRRSVWCFPCRISR